MQALSIVQNEIEGIHSDSIKADMASTMDELFRQLAIHYEGRHLLDISINIVAYDKGEV